MLTHWLEQQTEKLRARQKAEGVAEGLSIGVAQGQALTDARWREWYQKRLDEWYRQQIDKGVVLDEPLPPPPENPDDGA